MKLSILTAALLAATAVVIAQPRPLGDSRFVASVPSPGYPEGMAVYDGRFYVSGPAAFGVPGNFQPSTIFAYEIKSGLLVDTITIQGQTGPLNAISCIAFDDGGNLYVADESGRILKINVETKEQTTYSTPFYPVYKSAFNPPAPLLLNDLAFDKQGNLYVTDSFQATIWRVPPGGGAPQIWFQGPAIDGPFGPNGVRVDAKSEKLYFDVTFNSMGQGIVYTLPLIDHPTVADLKVFHTFAAGAGPDGIAFGKSGKLYVCLAGSSQIAVLGPNGDEIARYSGPAQTPDPSHPLVWQNPANIAFDDARKRILVTNHASLVPNPVFAVFDVYVNDHAGRLFGAEPEDEQ